MIDDVGLTPLDRAAGNAFFQVNRYDNNSTTIVTTNRGLPACCSATWPAFAAILDRLLHRAVVITIKGPSWRLQSTKPLVDRTRQGVEPGI